MSLSGIPNGRCSLRASVGAILCSLLLTAEAFAQPMELSWQKIGEGGGSISNQSYQITTTVGQAEAVSLMTNSYFSLRGGFWVDLEGAAIVSVISSPSNLWCCPGSFPTLTVVAGGSPPLAFQWRRNGVDLMDGPGVSGATTSNLRLLAIAPKGGGFFDVNVRNAYGSVTSAPVNLVVTSKPGLAVPIVSNGSILGATLVDGGCGYTAAPLISFTDIGGTGALAYANILDGVVANIHIVSGGAGYSTNTLLEVDPPVYPSLMITLGTSNVLRLEATDLMAGQTYQLKESAGDLSHWAGLGDFIVGDTTWRFTNAWSTSTNSRSFFKLQWSR